MVAEEERALVRRGTSRRTMSASGVGDLQCTRTLLLSCSFSFLGKYETIGSILVFSPGIPPFCQFLFFSDTEVLTPLTPNDATLLANRSPCNGEMVAPTGRL